jgi:hypothetical protein
MKPIIYTKHARAQMQLREVSESEVMNTIRDPETTQIGKRGAIKAFCTFPFNAQHNKVFYRFKRVEVRYLMKRTEILVLTVISHFFN